MSGQAGKRKWRRAKQKMRLRIQMLMEELCPLLAQLLPGPQMPLLVEPADPVWRALRLRSPSLSWSMPVSLVAV